MNLEQYEDILKLLYEKRRDIFYESFNGCTQEQGLEYEEIRKADLKDNMGLINAFKEANTHIVDLPPKKICHLPDYGDVFTAEEWMSEGYRGMAFIPSDGSGYWATEEGYSYDHSDVFGHKPAWATHVVWFNK